MTTIDYETVGDDGAEITLRLPARWQICCTCDGHGTDRGASVECDGGGFTGSEWSELDEEFREGYLAGRYDRPCGACDGSGKVLVVDRDRANPAELKLYDDTERELGETRAIERTERMLGA